MYRSILLNCCCACLCHSLCTWGCSLGLFAHWCPAVWAEGMRDGQVAVQLIDGLPGEEGGLQSFICCALGTGSHPSSWGSHLENVLAASGDLWAPSHWVGKWREGSEGMLEQPVWKRNKCKSWHFSWACCSTWNTQSMFIPHSGRF